MLVQDNGRSITFRSDDTVPVAWAEPFAFSRKEIPLPNVGGRNPLPDDDQSVRMSCAKRNLQWQTSQTADPLIVILHWEGETRKSSRRDTVQEMADIIPTRGDLPLSRLILRQTPDWLVGIGQVKSIRKLGHVDLYSGAPGWVDTFDSHSAEGVVMIVNLDRAQDKHLLPQ